MISCGCRRSTDSDPGRRPATRAPRRKKRSPHTHHLPLAIAGLGLLAAVPAANASEILHLYCGYEETTAAGERFIVDLKLQTVLRQVDPADPDSAYRELAVEAFDERRFTVREGTSRFSVGWFALDLTAVGPDGRQRAGQCLVSGLFD